MGQYAKKLHRTMASKAGSLPTKEAKRRPGELLPGGIKDVETLIKEGHDPIHAAYIYMQNFTSHFAEGVSQFPEMRAWADVVTKAEDEYMPSGPPMSPLTGSYFWMWAIYDLRIGNARHNGLLPDCNERPATNELPSTRCRQETGSLPDGVL